MNKTTYAKIAGAATFLVSSCAIECRAYLAPPFRLAIDILEVLSDGKHRKPFFKLRWIEMKLSQWKPEQQFKIF
jgi:hypothetical protein